MAGRRCDAGPSVPDGNNPIFLIPPLEVYTGQSSLVKKIVSFKMERLGLIGDISGRESDPKMGAILSSYGGKISGSVLIVA